MTDRDVELRRRGRLIAEETASAFANATGASNEGFGEPYLAFGAACAAAALAKHDAGGPADYDTVRRFLADCTVADPDGRAGCHELYARYRTWARFNGEAELPRKAFSALLIKKRLMCRVCERVSLVNADQRCLDCYVSRDRPEEPAAICYGTGCDEFPLARPVSEQKL